MPKFRDQFGPKLLKISINGYIDRGEIPRTPAIFYESVIGYFQELTVFVRF